MKKSKTAFVILTSMFFLLLFQFSLVGSDYLHTQGNKIVDANGREVWLTGINWFGFETNNNAFHGIWARDLKDVLNQIADLGFNIIRIPLYAELVQTWRAGNPAAPGSINFYQMNEYLEGLNSLEILDVTVDYCEQIGLKIMFDMHSIGAGTYMDNLWYTGAFSTQDLINVWVWLADHYKGDDVVIAFDLKNEPHGAYSQGDNRAIWDDSTKTNNWRKAAEDIGKAVLAANPELLVLVEGIQCYPKFEEGKNWDSKTEPDYYNTWWGGCLRGVKDYPINLGSGQNRLVYSPHEYGPGVYPQPWFEGNFTMDSLLTNLWRPNWFYLFEENSFPLLIGEWGGYLDGGNNEKWMRILRDFIVQHKIHHTFWCLNPNSGDTGGILENDWTTVSTAKYQIVEQALWQDAGGRYVGLDHEVILGSRGTNVTAYYQGSTNPPTATRTATVTRTPTRTPTSTTGQLLGDANGDGVVNIVDALIIAQCFVGITICEYNTVMDVNRSGTVDIVDALMVAQYAVGLITGF